MCMEDIRLARRTRARCLTGTGLAASPGVTILANPNRVGLIISAGPANNSDINVRRVQDQGGATIFCGFTGGRTLYTGATDSYPMWTNSIILRIEEYGQLLLESLTISGGALANNTIHVFELELMDQ